MTMLHHILNKLSFNLGCCKLLSIMIRILWWRPRLRRKRSSKETYQLVKPALIRRLRIILRSYRRGDLLCPTVTPKEDLEIKLIHRCHETITNLDLQVHKWAQLKALAILSITKRCRLRDFSSQKQITHHNTWQPRPDQGSLWRLKAIKRSLRGMILIRLRLLNNNLLSIQQQNPLQTCTESENSFWKQIIKPWWVAGLCKMIWW